MYPTGGVHQYLAWKLAARHVIRLGRTQTCSHCLFSRDLLTSFNCITTLNTVASTLMEFQITTNGREPIYRQVAAQIREGMARGKLRPGERLPSVRELSRTLVVNPNTIARVYTELEREGVLNTRQGMGVFVAPPSNDLTKTARRKKLIDHVDAMLTEAVHLGFSRGEVLDVVAGQAKQFQWGQT